MDFLQSVTKINLMKAFAGESQARNRYNISSKTARSEGYSVVGTLFDIIADQERQHAKVFYGFLKPANGETIQINSDFPVNNSKNTLELLEFAVSNELDESENVYKNFSETASKEGFTEISESFKNIAKIESRHAKLFEKFAKLVKSKELFSGDENTVWICEKCGNISVGKKPPEHCPVCSHPMDYFYRPGIFDLSK